VKRFAAYDPPEYVSWKRDAQVLRQYKKTITANAERKAIVDALSEKQLLELYAGLLRTRLTDIALKRMVKQGVLSKAWLATGEEAATVGPVHALRRTPAGRGDIVAPMIRNSGACHEMGMPVVDIFRAYMGTFDGPSRGRDGHYGDLSKGVLAPISHVGDMVPVAAGVALSFAMRGEDRVVLTWLGDGTTKTGAAHEGINFAAVQRLPVIFIIQNNQVALGTRLSQHHASAGKGNFEAWPRVYGAWGEVCDGNNVLDAFALTSIAAARCRAGEGPALLAAETFRMGGHATHDEAEARSTFDAGLFAQWGKRDPIGVYEEYLVAEGIARNRLEQIEAAVEAVVDAAQVEALESRANQMPVGESAITGVYASDLVGGRA
jgi:pyruvate dehydrogenase E1 component alpha subunit/2-oxoisovalerate dehydrogenase E1 component alpha subunit